MYGSVYKVREKKTGRIYALKKIKLDTKNKGGFPITALREIRILKQTSHPNVVQLVDIATSKCKDAINIYIVFEYCEYDLDGLLNLKFTEQRRYPFPIKEQRINYTVPQLK